MGRLRQVRIGLNNSNEWEVTVLRWWQDVFGNTHRETYTKKFASAEAAASHALSVAKVEK